MQVQIITAPTRNQVLTDARARLGADPLILSVKRRRKADGDDEWEAVVARDTPAAAEPITLPPSAVQEPGSEVAPRSGAALGLDHFERFREDLSHLRTQLSSGRSAGRSEVLALAHRLTVLEGEMLGAVLSGHSIPERWSPILRRLESAGYPKDEALRLLSVLQDRVDPSEGGMLRVELRGLLGQGVEVAPSNERAKPELVIFAGGTGVGKTTMAAKLAADLSLGGTKPPILGVIRPRPGAGREMIRRCAQTLGLDYVEAKSEEHIEMLARRALVQPVVLDSSSVNPFDERSMAELGRLLAPAPRAEVHATIPASHGEADFFRTLTAFSQFPRVRMSVTRLDEAPFVGRVLSAASRARTPVGYLSLGPRIPDDLARPGVETLVDAVLEEGAVAA